MMEKSERIIIYELEIENFKSYAGKRKLGPFHHSFTSVIGPNGSGKSNVIDAILFVFGYRSTKLRSKKVSNLIHNSEKYPNLDSCTVYVHFRKMIDGELDPEFELVISRTARKDNSNDYYINSIKSSYKEVTARLKELQIDLDHNRFLILQGEVEQISLMKPKGVSSNDQEMLEFLEDIIGTNKYNEQIKDLVKLVDEYDENMVEKINRVKVADIERNKLESNKNEALKYVQQENKMNSLLCLDLHVKLAELKAKDENILMAQANLKEQKKQFECELEGAETSNQAINKELAELEKACGPFVKTMDKHTKIANTLERKSVKCKQDFGHNEEMKHKMQLTLNDARKQYENAKIQPVKSQNELDKLNRGKNIIESEISEVEDKIQNLLPDIQKKTKPFQVEKEEKEKILLEKAKVLSEVDLKCNAAKNSLDALVSKRDRLTVSIQKNRKSHSELQTDINESKEKLKSSTKQLDILKSEVKADLSTLEEKTILEKEIAASLGEKRSALDYIKSNEASTRNRSKIVTELSKQSDSGKITGIFGRLGDLASVDPKYDVAVSSCCSQLDHFLVDNTDTAVKCVQFLRTNNLGIASFIALDKMNINTKAANTPFHCPPGSVRLFDLIKPDNTSYAPAFYFALRDTLVVESIDEGTKIAYSGRERYRVATLKGEIIEKSGTITCGGQPIKGRIRLNSERRISVENSRINYNPDKLAKEIDQLSAQQNELNNDITCIEHKIHACKISISNLKEFLEKGPKDLEIKIQELNTLVVIKSNLEKEYEIVIPDPNLLHKAQMDLEQQKKEKEKAQSNYDVVEEQIKKLNQHISQTKDNILGALQSEVTSKRRLLDDIITELSKATACVTANQRAITKYEATIGEIETNLERLILKCTQTQEELKMVETQLEEERETLAKLECENSTSAQKLNKLRSEVVASEQLRDSARQQLLDIKIKFDEISAHIKVYDSKVNQILHQIENLIIRNYSDEGEENTSPVPTPSEEEISKAVRDRIHSKIKEIQNYLDSNKPDFNAIEQFYIRYKVYLQRVNEFEQYKSEREVKNIELREFRSKRLTKFMDGFTTINLKLKEMYQLITLGGDAELELVDSLDPFIEGVVFSVRPPNKSWKHISNLSGGEKTLSSLSLVFALHHYKPTPFYIMDEIDAALDFKNVSIVANYIKTRTQDAQFIIISLRDNMFELANRLVGIYKTDNCTKSVVLYVDEMKKRNPVF